MLTSAQVNDGDLMMKGMKMEEVADDSIFQTVPRSPAIEPLNDSTEESEHIKLPATSPR